MTFKKSQFLFNLGWVLQGAISTISFIFFFIQFKSSWLYLNIVDDFGDLQWVLKRNGCFSQFGFLVYGNGTNSPECNGYIYGSSLLRAMDLIGTNLDSINLLGLFFIFIFVGTISTFIFYGSNIKEYPKKTIFILIYILSPVSVLLIQRANIDVAIFVLITCAGYLSAKNKSIYAILLITTAALMKFYSLPIMLLIIYLEKNSKLRKIYLIIFTLTALVIYIDFRYLESIPWDARNMFGNPIWGEYLKYVMDGPGYHQNVFVSQIMGFSITSALILSILFMNNRRIILPIVIISHRPTLYMFLFYFTSFLTCYFSGLSVDYRLVFLFSSYFVFCVIHSQPNKIMQVGMEILVISSFYLSFNVSNLQVFGDLCILVVISYMIATVIQNGKKVYFRC